jgi:hypothetical protein
VALNGDAPIIGSAKMLTASLNVWMSLSGWQKPRKA